MKVWITGIAGTLGSTLASYLLEGTNDIIVSGNDIVRPREAWRLTDIMRYIKYYWKSTVDLTERDLWDVDVIIDCGIGFADRPFGINSPVQNFIGNLVPAVELSRLLISMDNPPTLIYPSSFNVYYGLHGTYNEQSPLSPTSEYGWTKASVEMLYMAMHKQYGIPVIITTVGSEFGKKMRTDELVARLILDMIDIKKNNKKRLIQLRSPLSRRLWGYAMDIMPAYLKIIRNRHEFDGMRLFLAGNKGDKIVSNTELTYIIADLMGLPDLDVVGTDYEPGELVDGKPVDFNMDATFTRQLLQWKPAHTLEEGLAEVIEYFTEVY